MNAYDIDIKKLKESKEITEQKDLLKMKLVSEFLKITSQMDSSEILNITKLHKADLSRLRAMNTDRFTIDRLVGILSRLGCSMKFVFKKKVS